MVAPKFYLICMGGSFVCGQFNPFDHSKFFYRQHWRLTIESFYFSHKNIIFFIFERSWKAYTVCTISGRVKLANLTSVLGFEQSLPISLGLRSKKMYLSICFENGPNRKSNGKRVIENDPNGKCFHDFHH